MLSQINRIILILFAFIITSCSIDDDILSDIISIGEIKEEISQDIGASGGTLVISNPESSLNGLTITVPQNGYNETRNFSVSSAQITNHKIAEYFNPISPMILIKNGGGYSETPMTIKIPIEKAEDEVVMGFFYNEITGEIEALPTVELDDSSITVEMRHFALSSMSSEVNLMQMNESSAIGNLVLSSIDESELTGQTVISSGFTPGFDDWEFINFGSYITPGGHCAGQSLTAIWYYYEKRLKGESPLFHLFDKINDPDKPSLLWQDNPLGYRFASTIQEDSNWDGWVQLLDLASRDPKQTYLNFIYAMLITGEPQLVVIRNSDTGAGHAMIIYKINVPEGVLYVADPNFPNNRSSNGNVSFRTISYSNEEFDPYSASAISGGPGTKYDQIAIFAKTANIDWAQLTKRYQELKSETIGNDRLPSYDLTVKTSESTVPLVDEMTVTEETLEFYCRNTNIPESLPETDGLQQVYVFDTSGGLLAQTDASGIVKFKLSEGENKFGVYVCGYKNDKPQWYYDYQWFTVEYQQEDSTDNTCSGTPTVIYAETTYNTVQIGDQC